MNTNAEKVEIIRWIADLEDISTLQQLRKLKEESENQDSLSQLSESERISILRGLDDVKAGRVTPHNEVKQKYAKWL